jgi:hypothetical protein
VVTTRRHAPTWATRSARASTDLLRSLTPARLCALAKGANSTPARPISRLTPSKRSLSHGLLPCGGGHCRALAKGARGLHPPTCRHRQVLQVG